jgi:hypothetical protein
MQYKCTIVGVAVQQYAVVRCDIDRWEGSLMLHSYTVIRIYLSTYVTREDMDLPFVNKDIFGNISWYLLRIFC